MDNNMNNNYNNNNNNEYNIKLYNSVFNNKYLRKIIFNHLTIYNILNNNIQFEYHEQWQQFKHNEYLNNIAFDYEYEECEDLVQLPENINHIEFMQNKSIDETINNLKSIPNHIKSIKLFTKSSSSGSEFSTINSDILSKIVSLNMEPIDYNNQIEFNIGSLFKSLKHATLFNCSTSAINLLPSTLVTLEFLCYDDIFAINIDESIVFPETLQKLTIQCNSFSAKLPSNLKSLELTAKVYKDIISFPSSLEHIKISLSDDDYYQIFNKKESVPYNLKSLEILYSGFIDNNDQSVLPDKLEMLIINDTNFNQELQANQFPSSLTYLDLGYLYNQAIYINVLPSSLTYLNLGFSFNQVIEVNVLPSSLKTLVLGLDYTQTINPLAIPQQLELLEIRNSDYNHPINLPVSTHPNLLIDCNNLNLYYDPSNKSIRKLKLSNYFNSPLSTLKLQDKSSLEYLHLGYRCNQQIELSDLPINNNIKTLELFNQTINLEHFQNLETIIVKLYSNPKIITTTTTTNQQDIVYNNYNLKNIIVEPNYNGQFIINLDRNFYQFLKIKK